MSAETRLMDPQFWRQPLADRMREFIPIREAGPFVSASFENMLTGETETFDVVTRFAELVDISKRPKRVLFGERRRRHSRSARGAPVPSPRPKVIRRGRTSP